MAEHGISDTAFLTSAMRADLVDLSGDQLAELWVTPGARQLLEVFTNSVDPLGKRIVALRNRIFLDQTRAFFTREADGCFVSLAAGFTNYVQLFNRSVPCLEVDYPDIMELKQSRLTDWVEKGRLPQRPLTCIGTDLAIAANIQTLVAEISAFLNGRRAFVLLEGIVYYLKRDIVELLFGLLSQVLPQDSVIGFDFWKPDMARHPIFHTLQSHFAQGQTHPADLYFLFDEAFIGSFPRFEPLQYLQIDEVERLYTRDLRFTSWENTFPDYIATLKLGPPLAT